MEGEGGRHDIIKSKEQRDKKKGIYKKNSAFPGTAQKITSGYWDERWRSTWHFLLYHQHLLPLSLSLSLSLFIPNFFSVVKKKTSKKNEIPFFGLKKGRVQLRVICSDNIARDLWLIISSIFITFLNFMLMASIAYSSYVNALVTIPLTWLFSPCEAETAPFLPKKKKTCTLLFSTLRIASDWNWWEKVMFPGKTRPYPKLWQSSIAVKVYVILALISTRKKKKPGKNEVHLIYLCLRLYHRYERKKKLFCLFKNLKTKCIGNIANKISFKFMNI